MFLEDVVGLIEKCPRLIDVERRYRQERGIQDDWCCNVKAPMTELSSGPYVAQPCLHVEPNGDLTGYRSDVGQWNADVLEIRWTRAPETVPN